MPCSANFHPFCLARHVRVVMGKREEEWKGQTAHERGKADLITFGSYVDGDRWKQCKRNYERIDKGRAKEEGVIVMRF